VEEKVTQSLTQNEPLDALESDNQKTRNRQATIHLSYHIFARVY
jgi:hypothetical protein